MSSLQDSALAAPALPPRFIERPWATLLASVAAILCAIAAAYSNGVGNTFTLDDAHTITNNPAVRNLASIPRYFVDARTFSTLSTNVDYRPVLQTTYALNYAMAAARARAQGRLGDGYETPVWNMTNIAIHAWVALCVTLLGRRLIGSGQLAPIAGVSPVRGDAIALAAGVLVAVHPAFSGAVNYISGRSSTLTAALTLPVLLIYLRQLQTRRTYAWLLLGGLLYALALLTKIEAVAMLGVLFVAEILLNPASRAWPILPRLFAAAGFGRLLPFAILSLLGVLLWKTMSPLQDSSTRAEAGMTALRYLATEVHAWWYYVGQFVAPVEQMTENLSYPVSWFGAGGRTPVVGFAELLTLLACAGWLIVLTLTARGLRRGPAVCLCVLAFFVMLAPHSSVVPLAEYVNEHRPYLSLAFLALAAAIGGDAAWRWALGRRAGGRAVLVSVLVLSVPLVLLTRERNALWKSELLLWGDNASKQPRAARVQMQYGLALMAKGDYGESERALREAVRLLPQYAWAHLNLGLCLAAQGRDADALEELDRAVAINASREVTHYWRGRFFAQRHQWAKAAEDFRAAAGINPTADHVAAWAVSLEQLGRMGEARAAVDTLSPGDQPAVEESRRAFALAMNVGGAPPAAQPEAQALLTRGLELLAAARFAEAEQEFRRAMQVRPDWLPPVINLGIALSGQGDAEGARVQFDRALAMQPLDHEAHFFRARFLAQQGRYEEAARGFAFAETYADSAARRTLARGYRIEALRAAGSVEESEALVQSTASDDRDAVYRARQDYHAVVRDR